MNTAVIKQSLHQIVSSLNPYKISLLVLTCILLSLSSTSHTVFSSLSDAFFQVTVFVGLTLLLINGIEKFTRSSLEVILSRHHKWQVLIAAGLGVLPGCGGAVIVTSQYISGNLSFGAVVAVLIATMGDAAFLLIAKSPADALLLFSITFPVAVVTGKLIDMIHPKGKYFKSPPVQNDEWLVTENELLKPLYNIWRVLLLIGIPIGLLIALQYDLANETQIFAFDWITPIGGIAALLCLSMWTFNPFSDIRYSLQSERRPLLRITDMCNFVTVWVAIGFVGFELFNQFSGIDLKALFNDNVYWVIIIATLIGFIPGCGPQIIVTTMFLSGIIPFSALLANAISNDGDALFPAIAVQPRAAIFATLYGAIPALIMGFSWYLLFE